MKITKSFVSSTDAGTAKQRIVNYLESAGYRQIVNPKDYQTIKAIRGSVAETVISGNPARWRCKCTVSAEPEGSGTRVTVTLDVSLKLRLGVSTTAGGNYLLFWDNEVYNLEATVAVHPTAPGTPQEAGRKLSKVTLRNALISAIAVGVVTGVLTAFNPIGNLTNWFNQRNWQTFTSPDGTYSILMPAEPKQSTKTANSAAGPMDVYTVSVSQGDFEYGVSYTDYPSTVIQKIAATKLLDGSRDGAVAAVRGKLLSEELISKDGNPGRDLRVASADGNWTVRAQLFLVGNRMYALTVTARNEDAFSKNINQFLDSFKLATRSAHSVGTRRASRIAGLPVLALR